MRRSSIFLGFALALVASCLHPNPSPQPGPTPVVVNDAGPVVADAYPTNAAFTDKTFDCTLPVVSSQRADATTSVEACVVAPPAGCLADLVGALDVNTVACVARDVGASAQLAARAGSVDPLDALRAKAVRDWILAERIGYR